MVHYEFLSRALSWKKDIMYPSMLTAMSITSSFDNTVKPVIKIKGCP